MTDNGGKVKVPVDGDYAPLKKVILIMQEYSAKYPGDPRRMTISFYS